MRIGCEMIGTEHKEEQWRELIAKVREIYHGPLVYNANHGKEENVTWFDALDYIGTSAYYPVEKEGGASADEMVKAWEHHKVGLCSSGVPQRRGRAGEFLRERTESHV